jgi:transposase-like protein
MLKPFKSLSDLRHAFPDEDACINHFRTLRWPEADKIACPHCGVIGAHYTLKNNTHKCRDCLKKFSVRNGTIFEDSKISLMKWFEAIFLMTSHKKGISSCQLARDCGVTQKTAWFMLHRIRNAAMTKEFKAPLRGTVEIDEAYVGPKPKFQHASKRLGKRGNFTNEAKKIVFGMAERGGHLRLAFISNTEQKTTVPIIDANIQRRSRVHTDDSTIYDWMDLSYLHDSVKHSLGEYVRGDVTTNSVEGAFSHFKRTMVGTYHKASRKHLDRYLQMFAFRWNRRTKGKRKNKVVYGEDQRVNDLLRATKGRRLTYKTLIA